MSTLGNAIAIAAYSHRDIRDKGGNAYILHPIRIMMRLRTSDEELMIMAIMHDVLEDDNAWTVERLKEEGFSQRVINALTLLTHVKSDTYEEYIRKISINDDAIRVKLEDLKDNSDLSRLKGVTQKDFDRVVKYQKAYRFLTSVQKAKEVSYS